MSVQKNGFSLMELVIALAIISILAVIALPSYNASIERTRRADCSRYLLQVSSKQAQFYTQYSSYTDTLKAAENCTTSSCGLNLATDRNDHNTCTVTIHTAPNGCGPATNPFVPCTDFTLIGTLDNDKKCATVSLDNLGQKQATAQPRNSLVDNALVDFCWR